MEVLIQNLANITLPSVIMWIIGTGYLGIFIVTGVIIAAVALLNKLTSGK